MDGSDPFMAAQVTHRCAGLYGAMARFMPKGQKEGPADIAAKFLEKTFLLLIKGNKGAEEKIGEELLKDSRYFVSVYENQMDLSQNNTGSIFSDWIKSEFDHCELVAKAMF